jgi:diguanylate cyclase (GGDEF)-like protein
MIPQLILEKFFDLMPFGVYVVDVESLEIVYASKTRLNGREAVGGEPCWKAIYCSDRQCHFCKVPDLIGADGKPNGKSIVFENFNEEFDIWHQVQEQAIIWPDGRTVKYSIAVDISQTKEIQNRLAEAHAELSLAHRNLEKAAMVDSLTGLYNRRKLDEVFAYELAQTQRYGHPFSVVMVDIDTFKSVNDTWGHQAGDQVLQAVADILRATARDTDLPGRWGGEEFMVLAPKTDLDGAYALAERIRQRVAAHGFDPVGHMTSSFGVAGYRPGDKANTLVKRADDALYRAKQNGRDRVEREVTG